MCVCVWLQSANIHLPAYSLPLPPPTTTTLLLAPCSTSHALSLFHHSVRRQIDRRVYYTERAHIRKYVIVHLRACRVSCLIIGFVFVSHLISHHFHCLPTLPTAATHVGESSSLSACTCTCFSKKVKYPYTHST